MAKPPCFECGFPSDVHHHVVPESRGGKRTVPLCYTCHDLAHDVTMKSLSDPSRRYTDEAKQNIRRLYEKGYSTQLIEEITGVSWQTCRRLLKAMGVEMRRPGRPKGTKNKGAGDYPKSSYSHDGQWRITE